MPRLTRIWTGVGQPGLSAEEATRLWTAYAKNGERRSVHVNEVLLTTLKTCKMTIPSHGPHEPVFCTSQGTPYGSFRTAFEHVVRTAGIVDLTFPDLQYTFASRLVMVDLPTVQALTGHKDSSMTLCYAHLSSNHRQRAVKAQEVCGEQARQIFQQGNCNSWTPIHKYLILCPWAASSIGRATDS